MWDYLEQVSERPWMGIYLRILTLLIAYGALVHVANLAGFGEMPWGEMPLTWKVGDIVYGIWDIAIVVGLWQKAVWGIICLLGAIFSQFIIYTVFIDYFAFTAPQRETVYGLLGTEAILVLVFLALLIFKK